jgi:UDP-3-O-[3-hydroxymyristoyl] glucosamine N-acyltransferase
VFAHKSTTMKALLAATFIIFTLNAYSQSKNSASTEYHPANLENNEVDLSEEIAISDTTIIKIDPSLPNGIMLYGTQMVIVKNGVVRKMKKDVVLSNGTRVRTDGFIFRKNRYQMLLNFGEYVDASGNILPIIPKKTTTQ